MRTNSDLPYCRTSRCPSSHVTSCLFSIVIKFIIFAKKLRHMSLITELGTLITKVNVCSENEGWTASIHLVYGGESRLRRVGLVYGWGDSSTEGETCPQRGRLFYGEGDSSTDGAIRQWRGRLVYERG
jgi:hypothetical protein